jgi:dynactin 1
MEQLVGICELKGQLTLFANITRRFASITKRATPDDYLALATILPEVVSLERPFDNWIELMKRDEFQERDCAVELSR